MRMLGFDCLYRNDYEDAELAAVSREERRILLSRDRGLLKRSEVTHAHWVRTKVPRQQLVEIVQRFDLYSRICPFQRCLVCNHLLKRVDKTEVLPMLQPDTIEAFEEFHICPSCNRIYWKGTHYERMQKFIQEVIS